MRAPSSTEISLFGSFRLDHRSGVLFRRDERGVFTPLAMGSRALGILGVLLARPGELVSRAEIIAAVWPGTAVEDSNLNVQIAALRRVLREGQAERRPKLLLAIQDDPDFPMPYRYLAACFAHMGRLDEAHRVIAQLRAMTSVVVEGVDNFRNPEHREFYLSGLRLAAGEAT